MLKFIRGKGQQPSAERQKLQRELFAFRKTLQHGFPNKPTCLAWDPSLRLIAIGTANGAIKILGKPGVEFYGHHASNDISVTKLIFIPNQARLISLCEDNSLHLWEINDNTLEEIRSHSLEGKLKKISTFCFDNDAEHLLLGTEGGNVYLLSLPSFKMSETIIYQDVVIQNVGEDFKVNPGAVEAMAIQPNKPDNLLIGYNRGLIVLWNMKCPAAEQTYVSAQGVESLCWSSDDKFVSSHNDGSYTTWQVKSPDPVSEPNTVFGPFPCKAITKIVLAPSPTNQQEDMVIFTGGMQRASYSDRHTISVLDGKRQVVFDFTSKVIDFFVAKTSDSDVVLICLAEEELVGIDLSKDGWPMVRLPYLVSLHASAVTCTSYVSDLPQNIWDDIVKAGETQQKGLYCDTVWPVDGGEAAEESEGRDVLITGHEDGSVRLWAASSVSMTPLYKFSSSQVLTADDLDDLPPAEQDEDEWPPFKKVGTFDPYSDDPRLAVKKVLLCPETGTIAVAGTSGHIIVAKLCLEKKEFEPKVTTMNIMSSRDGFEWKGHSALNVRRGTLEGGPGLVPSAVLQLHPPACVTALALKASWGVVAAGTAHGVALYDWIRGVPVAVKCTLSPGDASGAGDAPISRRKSFKKSLRESFRRLRRGRSTRHQRATTTGTTTASPTRQSPDIETKPVERAVEARSADDTLGSMVRCLTFSSTYIITMQCMTPTLWAGMNSGTVFVFTICIPAKRMEESVSCQLGKEIQLKHRAPVISISLIDGHGWSVDMSRGNEQLVPPHRVIISSEEQIKMFSLPQLKPVCKLKLTAGEGARVRRTALCKFSAGEYIETCLVCLTNLGDVIVLSLPDLRRQLNAAVIKREDINGISSVSLSEEGEAVYLHSSSELQRVSVSGSKVTYAKCRLSLPPGARQEPRKATSQTSLQNQVSEKGECEKSIEEIKENGVSDSMSGHDVTLSSVGDITIDSVKDHLTNNSVVNIEDSRTVSMEIVKNESTKLETTMETVVVKSTVITTSSETNQHNSTAPAETDMGPTEDSSPPQPEVRKAPLARLEEMDGEPVSS